MIQKELAMNWHDPLPTTAPISRRLAAVILTCGLLASLPVLAQTPPSLGDAEIVKALRAGGLVILLRHGATFSDQTDKVPFNFDDLASQRNLNDKGKALAQSFWDALRQVGVPVGKVFTSQFHRAYETAILAGFENIEKTHNLTLSYAPSGLVVSPGENNRRAQALRQMLSLAPGPGTNTVLITHQPNIVDALGKEFSNVKEGEALVFRPENGKFALFARIPMEAWPRLASAAK